MWSVSSKLQIVSSSNTSVSVKAINNSINGEADITASYGSANTTKTVWVGKPETPDGINNYPNQPCVNQNVICTVRDNNYIYNDFTYEWSGIQGLLIQDPRGKEVHFRTKSPNPYNTYIRVKATNSCGSSSTYSKLISVVDCGGGGNPAPHDPITGFSSNGNKNELQIYPNPVNEVLFINFPDNSLKNISIYSVSGQLIKTINKSQSIFEIDTSKLPNGLYFVYIQQDDEKITKKIIVQH